jgi:hypothetical protein
MTSSEQVELERASCEDKEDTMLAEKTRVTVDELRALVRLDGEPEAGTPRVRFEYVADGPAQRPAGLYLFDYAPRA